jgi:hypothetical protein
MTTTTARATQVAPLELPKPGLRLVLRLLSSAIYGVALVSSAVIATLGQSYTTERICYVMIALIVTPVAVASVVRSTRQPVARANLVAHGTLILVAATLIATRLSGTTHASVVVAVALVLGELLLVPAAAAIARRLPERSFDSLVPVPLVLVAAALALAPAGGRVTVGRLCVAVAAALVVAMIASRVGAPRPPRVRRVLDWMVVLVLALAVAELSPLNFARVLNMNYFLGPTNDVLHGRPMLIDTYSQYGVGMFYALAGLFKVVPLGYGTFTWVLAIGTALVFACIYLILRIALRSQLIAAAGAVCTAFVYVYSIGVWQYLDYPSTSILRFGLPWLVTLASVAVCCSGGRRRRVFHCSLFALVGFAAIWSAETGMYSLGCACAMALVDCFSREVGVGERCRAALREVARLVGCAVAGWLLLNLATLIFAGQLPDWGPYIALIRLYTLSGFGLLPIAAWSQGLAVGAIYSTAAVLVVGLLTLSPTTVRSHLPAFSAIACVAVMGTLEFTYFLGRAAPSNLMHVSPPVVTVLFLLLGTVGMVLGAHAPRVSTAAGIGFLACLLVLGARPYMSAKFDNSALGELTAAKPSISAAVNGLGGNPVYSAQAATLAQLLRSPRLSSRPLALIATPQVESEALIRARRANDIESSNPCQSALSQTAPARVLNGVRSFPLGGVMIVYTAPGQALLPLQTYELALMRHRFDMRKLDISSSLAGAEIFTMTAARRTWHGGTIAMPTHTLNTAIPNCA